MSTTEDRSFKELFISYPVATLEVFAPELLAARGIPTQVQAVQQEVPFPDLLDPSRYLDVGLLCTWADGSRMVVLLIEHWSDARKVDLDRVHWYHAALRLRHRAPVLPIVLVTDPNPRSIPDRLDEIIEGIPVLSFQVRVVRVTSERVPQLRKFQNAVSAALLSLAVQDYVEAVAVSLAAMREAGVPPEELRRWLPLLMKSSRIPDGEIPRLRQRLRQEPDMVNVLEEVYQEGKAQGKTEGKAEGRIAEIRHLTERGYLSVDAARKAIQDLIATNAIPAHVGQDALSKLG